MAWSYLPHTPEDRSAMLETIGIKKAAELFADVPEEMRLNRSLNLPAALSEYEVAKLLKTLAQKNANTEDYACFLGAGAYDHYIPSVVSDAIGRSEFLTAYTQYQAEISQGYLQALWEYQTMICQLTGMDVANASLYDGGTAVAEAVMMACSSTRRNKVLIARSVHPHYREVLGTYGRDRDYQVDEIAYADGVLDQEKLKKQLDKTIAAVVVQTPNFFGCLEDLAAVAELTHAQKALLIVAADPISLGVLAAPGTLGADVVVGEGQSLGLPLSFGGPYLGFFATTRKLMHKMPGRIVGQTTDCHGQRGFVLTLQAREQHIRRQKATSNICSNEALCALAATVYLSAVGKEGLRTVAMQCLQKAHYAAKELAKQCGCTPAFGAPFFQEFVVKSSVPAADVNKALLAEHMIGGLDLEKYYPELPGTVLLCVTEKRTKAEIDRLVAGWEAAK